MRHQDIQEGETYLFVATTNPARKDLEGLPFRVVRKELVIRHLHGGKRRRGKVWRCFNEDGVGARPDELEPLNDTSDGGLLDLFGPGNLEDLDGEPPLPGRDELPF